MSSRSPRAERDLTAATAELRRRSQAGTCFASVRHALRYYFERGEAMQHPLAQHPRGHQAPDGSTVYLQVDGGRGGDIDDVLATLQTIHTAMVELRDEHPVAAELLVLSARDGVAFTELGRRAKCSPSTVSAEVGRAESFLLGWLRREGVVIPGRAHVG